jgi:hypothetical protein
MHKVIRRHIRHRGNGVDLDVDLNAVVAVNCGSSETSSVQSTTVTQSSSARADSRPGQERSGDHRDEPRKEGQ